MMPTDTTDKFYFLRNELREQTRKINILLGKVDALLARFAESHQEWKDAQAAPALPVDPQYQAWLRLRGRPEYCSPNPPLPEYAQWVAAQKTRWYDPATQTVHAGTQAEGTLHTISEAGETVVHDGKGGFKPAEPGYYAPLGERAGPPRNLAEVPALGSYFDPRQGEDPSTRPDRASEQRPRLFNQDRPEQKD